MCEHFINSFTQKVLEKNPIYHVKIKCYIPMDLFFQCSSLEEVLNKMHEKYYEVVLSVWKKPDSFLYDHGGIFYFFEHTQEIIYQLNKPKKYMKKIERHKLEEFAETHFLKMLKVYLKSDCAAIEINKIKIE